MRKYISILIVSIMVLGVSFTSCAKKAEPKADTAKTETVIDTTVTAPAAVAAATCAMCGEVKGSEKCCKPADKCGKCGLHKGSPGCCKPVAKADTTAVKTCAKCGEVKGSDKCCKPK